MVQPYKLRGLEKIKIETHTMANAEIANHLPRSSRSLGTIEFPCSMFSPASSSRLASYMLGITLADDLSVVRDTRIYPYVLLGVACSSPWG